jgi:hypothetical protein
MTGSTGRTVCTFPNGEIVEKHKDFRLVLAANTWGNGANAEYCGRQKLDGASTNRWLKMSWDYDEELELALTQNADWTRYVQRVRAKAFDLGMKVVISPRASLSGVNLLNAGLPRAKVAELLLWNGMSKDDRARLAVVR